MNDRFEFLEVVSGAYEGLKTEEEIEKRTEEMIELILSQSMLTKGYLKAGIL